MHLMNSTRLHIDFVVIPDTASISIYWRDESNTLIVAQRIRLKYHIVHLLLRFS